MKDEIKEILDELESLFEISEAPEHITNGFNKLKDCITNLQERCEYLQRSCERKEDEIMSLRDECVDGEMYKSRIDKAIEYIKWNLDANQEIVQYFNYDGNFNKLLNILQGSDKE